MLLFNNPDSCWAYAFMLEARRDNNNTTMLALDNIVRGSPRHVFATEHPNTEGIITDLKGAMHIFLDQFPYTLSFEDHNIRIYKYDANKLSRDGCIYVLENENLILYKVIHFASNSIHEFLESL